MTAMISRREENAQNFRNLLDDHADRPVDNKTRDQCGYDGDERVKYYAEKNGHNVEYTKLGIAETLECLNFAGYI